MNRFVRVAGLLTAATLLGGAPAFAQGAIVTGWYSTTDLSVVATEGNTKSISAGFTTNITRKWLRTEWVTDASFVFTSVAEPTRQAIGTGVGDASLEVGPRVTKSEKYFIDSQVIRRITERVYWNVGGTGERDQFAGLDYRLTGVLGVGYIFTSPQQSGSFSAGIGATYTTQEETVPDPETEDNFFGVRFTANGEARFGEQKQNAFTSDLVVDENLQDTDDLRFNWINAISAALTRNNRLALKVGLQLTYDNQPQLVEFPIFTSGGVDTGFVINGPAEKLDASLTVSLVLNFAPGGGGERVP